MPLNETETNSSGERLDVALIYPPWAVLDDRAILQNSLPPIGILSIASHLESLGRTARVLDIHGEKLEDTDLINFLHEHQPRFVGISVLTNMAIPAHKIAQMCKQHVPDCVVVMGGAHAEAMPERMLRNTSIDAIVRGDGEEAMAEIVAGIDFKKITGLSYREGHKIVHNGPRQVEMDLDKFPLPAYHLVDFDYYFPAVGSYRNLPAINMLMTRGCPGKCNFCNSASTVLRSRGPESMVNQIKFLHENYGIRQIQFYDDTFTAQKRACLEFCELMEKADMDVTWVAYVRGDCFSDRVAAAMKRSGCHQILMGVESGNEEISVTMGKPIKKKEYFKAMEIARRHDLEVRATFIIGHLGETWDTMLDTLNFAIDLDVDLFQLNICTPYPGTALYREVKERGWLKNEDWNRYGQGSVLFSQPQLPDEKIYEFERYAFRRFYLRPKVIWRMMKRITSWRHIYDYYKATMHLLIGKQKRGSGDWSCWKNLKEEEFLDFVAEEPVKPRLTYELRQHELFS